MDTLSKLSPDAGFVKPSVFARMVGCRLLLRRGHRIFFVSPFFSAAGVAYEPRDGESKGDQHLAGLDNLVPLHAVDRGHGVTS